MKKRGCAMENDWRFYTTHEGINSIRNSKLDEKNYYRMKIFMKNYFRGRFAEDNKKSSSLLFSIVMSISGGRDSELSETPFLCRVNVDEQKLALSWANTTGVCVTADSREGNCVIRELYQVLKKSEDNEFWKL